MSSGGITVRGMFTLCEKQDDLRRKGMRPLSRAEASTNFAPEEVDAYFARCARREPEAGTTYRHLPDRTEIRLNGTPVFSIYPFANDDEVYGAVLGFNAASALLRSTR